MHHHIMAYVSSRNVWLGPRRRVVVSCCGEDNLRHGERDHHPGPTDAGLYTFRRRCSGQTKLSTREGNRWEI